MTKGVPLKIRKIGDVTFIETLFKELSKENCHTFKAKVAEIINQTEKNIILNLNSVEDIDRAGLSNLISIQRLCLYKSKTLRLYGLSENVAGIIQETRVDRIFDICNDVNESFDQVNKLYKNYKYQGYLMNNTL